AMAAQLRFRFDAATGNARDDAAPPARVAAFAMIVAFVGMRLGRTAPRSAAAALLQRWDGIEEFFEDLAVVEIRRTQSDREWDALGVDHKMAFATRLAFIRWIRADGVAPLFAATLELSMATRLQSISSAHASSFNNTPCSRRHTPRWVHCWKRRQQVEPLPHPISTGSSCHGVPVRSTNKMPVSTARFETRGRPPFRPCFRLRGNNGSTTAHRSSVTRGFIPFRRLILGFETHSKSLGTAKREGSRTSRWVWRGPAAPARRAVRQNRERAASPAPVAVRTTFEQPRANGTLLLAREPADCAARGAALLLESLAAELGVSTRTGLRISESRKEKWRRFRRPKSAFQNPE